jgi:diacylglycerol kinase family enzyme
VAVLAPVAMIIVAAVALIGELGIAALAVALAAAAVACIWRALTTRGASRVLACVLAVLASGGLVVVVATHLNGVLVLLVLLALLAVFGAASRYALGRAGGAERARARLQVIEAPPAHAPALLMNPRSGGGKAERFGLADEARKRGIEAIVLRPGDDLLALAEDAIARGANVIGMAGGDGSQALVATVASRHDVAHVCIPAGTRNHFALDLGLDRDDLVGALDAFTDGLERRIDLAQVNDRVFVNNASLGVYAKVVQSDEYRDAKLETWTRMLPDLLGPEADPIDLEFTSGDGENCDDAPLVLVSNNSYELTHLAGAGTRETLDSGSLGVVAARVRTPAEVSTLVGLELVGQAGRYPRLLSWTAAEFEVRSGGPVAVGLDGEAVVLEPPLHFRTLPGALRVRVPRAAGLAPAARAVALTRGNLGELLRVAAGR